MTTRLSPFCALALLLACGDDGMAIDVGTDGGAFPVDAATGVDGAMPRDAGDDDAGSTADDGGVYAATPIPTSNGGPVLVFSDLINAPSSGWGGGDASRGAVVTVWGRNLGATRGESFVTVNGVDLVTDADYPEAWGEAWPVPFLQRVTFWLHDGVPAGAGEIRLTIGGETSNALPFTVGSGSIYFVDGDAGSAGSGTHDDPWDDPSEFIDVMAPGDVCYFREASYDQRYNGGKQNIWVRDTEPSGTAAAPISFVAYPNERPLFDSRSGGSRDFHSSFRLAAANLTVAKLSIDGWAIGVAAGEGSRVIGNDVRGGANFLSGSAIITAGANRAEIYGNAVHGGRTENRLDHGIYISGCAPEVGNRVAYNYIYDNSFDRGPLIVVNHQDERCPSDVFVRSHYIHHNLVDCRQFGSRGIGLYDLSWDGTPEIEPEPTFVFDNILLQCGTESSPAMYQNAAHGRFYNNTLVGSRQRGIAVSGGRVLSTEIVNNVIELATDTDYISASDGEVTISHNLYSGAGAYEGPDDAPVNEDPGLSFDLDTFTFELDPSSAAIDRGSESVPGTVSRDFRLVGRSQGDGIDIGAIEHLAPD